MSKRKYIISVKIENKIGALARSINLFSKRGYNIESLVVAPSEDNDYSYITIGVSGDSKIIEQICKQLYRIIEVVKVNETVDNSDLDKIIYELMILRVKFKYLKSQQSQSDILVLKAICDIYEAKIIESKDESYILKISAHPTLNDSFIKKIKHKFSIIHLVRTGPLFMDKS